MDHILGRQARWLDCVKIPMERRVLRVQDGEFQERVDVEAGEYIRKGRRSRL